LNKYTKIDNPEVIKFGDKDYLPAVILNNP